MGTTLHKQTEGTQDEDKQNKNTTQHNKCWAPLYINKQRVHKTKTNKAKTQHNKCWAITLHKQTEGTQDEDKQNKNTTQ